jgi:hypothetical protein
MYYKQIDLEKQRATESVIEAILRQVYRAGMRCAERKAKGLYEDDDRSRRMEYCN